MKIMLLSFLCKEDRSAFCQQTIKTPWTSSSRRFWHFLFFAQSKEKASKKSNDFLERGKTYVVYLQNFVLFYTEYVLTRYSSHSQENEIQKLSQQLKIRRIFMFLQYKYQPLRLPRFVTTCILPKQLQTA